MRLIDSHCHIHDTEFFSKQLREDAYERAIAAEIGMICVGTDQRSSEQAVEFARTHPNAWAVVGVHPHDAKFGCQPIEQLAALGATSKVIGIGEIGLDYFYLHSSRNQQVAALEAQLQIAVKYDLPVSFHVRDGFNDFWPILDNFRGVRGVLHSFTDSADNLEKGFERGLYVGINGISTFTKDALQRQLYQTIPLEKMLLETDAPFLTPYPNRGKVNEPAYVELVARYWSKVRNIALEDILVASLHNTQSLFNI